MRKLVLLGLLFCFSTGSQAAECEPTNDPGKLIAAARGNKSIVLEGAQALAFAVEARSQGVPMPDPDYVFLDLSGTQYEAEWLENAKDRVALSCSWQGKADSKFGRLIARWAKPA